MDPNKKKLALLFADGRERTFNDVCFALKAGHPDARQDVLNAMRSMQKKGLLKSEHLHGVTPALRAWSKVE